jgi:hypothetical protein
MTGSVGQPWAGARNSVPTPAAPWLGLIDPGCTRRLCYFNGRVPCG